MTDLPFPSDAIYLSVKEVAKLFRVSTKTIRRWIYAGDLPATRLGRDWRIARSDAKTFAAAREYEALAHVL